MENSPKMIDKDGSEDDVRGRVEACRKRLRVLRAIHKAQIHFQMTGEGELPRLHRQVDVSDTPSGLEESALVVTLVEAQDAQIT
jgi:hypothetical protein